MKNGNSLRMYCFQCYIYRPTVSVQFAKDSKRQETFRKTRSITVFYKKYAKGYSSMISIFYFQFNDFKCVGKQVYVHGSYDRRSSGS